MLLLKMKGLDDYSPHPTRKGITISQGVLISDHIKQLAKNSTPALLTKTVQINQNSSN